MGKLVRRGKFGSRSLNKIFGSKGTVLNTALAGSVLEEDFGGIRRSKFKLTNAIFNLVDQAGVIAYAGKKLGDFPEGDLFVLGATANLVVTGSSTGVIAAFNGDFSVGTVTASNNATLTTTEANIIPSTPTPAAVARVTSAKGRLAAPVSFDGTAGALSAFLNFLVDDTDHDVTTTPANLLVTGTVEILWATAGDY